MLVKLRTWKMRLVALRKESVDRNVKCSYTCCACYSVALRKESVDRNEGFQCVLYVLSGVALRKESVDRNVQQALKMMKNTESLSVRRAWIEILRLITLLKVFSMSLSVRRAWIEILFRGYYTWIDGCRSP